MPGSRSDHDHVFGQDARRPGERRTLLVIALTSVTMVVEIVAGIAFGSMALLADGLHMGSHAIALAIAAFAYVYARRRAADHRFSFGTGKVNALAGFSGAVLLAGFAGGMAFESVERLVHPVGIAFDRALVVAVVGLVVNGVSALVLGGHGAGHDHDHHHAHGAHGGNDHHHDHNLRSAYLHVIADALTSVLAIAALLAGKHLGWSWLDPVIGVMGAFLVGRWSVSLLRDTAVVLLDRQAAADVLDGVRSAVELPGDVEVVDLHVWSIGPGIRASEIVVVPAPGQRPDPAVLRRRIPSDAAIVHATIEVREARGLPLKKGPGS